MLALEQLEALLRGHLGCEILVCEFVRAACKDSLLKTYTARIRSAKTHNADRDVIVEMENFVKALESLDSDVDLYAWDTRTAFDAYAGITTEKQVIYTHKYKDKENK